MGPREAPLVQPFPPSPYDMPQDLRPATQSLFFRPIPYMPPMGVSPSSVITQQGQGDPIPERLMPPPNRPARTVAPPPDFSLTPPATPPPSPWPSGGNSFPTPPAGLLAGQLTSREFAQLRLEMRSEIDQVRDDVFGAATGVSAVRDRLDGLETRMTKLEQLAVAAVEAAPRLEDWQRYIDDRVQQGVRTALGQGAETAPPPPDRDATGAAAFHSRTP